MIKKLYSEVKEKLTDKEVNYVEGYLFAISRLVAVEEGIEGKKFEEIQLELKDLLDLKVISDEIHHEQPSRAYITALENLSRLLALKPDNFAFWLSLVINNFEYTLLTFLVSIKKR